MFLAIAGAADVLSAVFRSTIVQLETPDALRGRVTSIHILVVTSGPRLGDIEAATVGAMIGPQLSVITGGLLCVAGVGVVARLFPELAAHVSRSMPGSTPALAVAPAQGGAGVENSKSNTSSPGSKFTKNGGIVRVGIGSTMAGFGIVEDLEQLAGELIGQDEPPRSRRRVDDGVGERRLGREQRRQVDDDRVGLVGQRAILGDDRERARCGS